MSSPRGWHAHPEQKYKVGWLQVPERADRRNQNETLTPRDIELLLAKVKTISGYSKLHPDTDQIVRLRDAAVIALWWLFFKRGGEVLSVLAKNVDVAEDKLVVRYELEKKRHFVLVCKCGYENNRRDRKNRDGAWIACKKCGVSLETAARQSKSDKVESLKRRTLKDPFCQYVLDWKTLVPQEAKWFFPKFQFFKNSFVWDSQKPLTVQWFDKMLQRLDYSLTSHMARYGHTEVLFRAKTPGGSPKYNVHTITQRGDWESYAMPMRYAKRKSISEDEAKMEDDVES